VVASIRSTLEPIASWMAGFGLPEPIVHWGHPLMMGIVVVVMGGYAAYMGWRARLTEDQEVADSSRASHRMVAPLMFMFITLGYTGGVLSLVMQDHPIFESAHFWTGSAAILILGLNSVSTLGGFFGSLTLRSIHAYVGSAALALLFVHLALGIKLGLSI